MVGSCVLCMGMTHARVNMRGKRGKKSILYMWWRQCWVSNCGLGIGMWCWQVVGQEWNAMCGGRAMDTVAGVGVVGRSWCLGFLWDRGFTGGMECSRFSSVSGRVVWAVPVAVVMIWQSGQIVLAHISDDGGIYKYRV